VQPEDGDTKSQDKNNNNKKLKKKQLMKKNKHTFYSDSCFL
jgi:hypothetical protein